MKDFKKKHIGETNKLNQNDDTIRSSLHIDSK